MSTEDHTDDYKKTMHKKRFFNEIEQGIRIANREIIHALIPGLDKNAVLSFSVAIGRLRARYLDAALKVSANDSAHEPLNVAQIKELREHRQAYEESRDAFEALRDAIERGYVDLDLSDE